MSAKTNIRSFRYSDEVAGILQAFTGATLNEKFENLVLHCFWERQNLEKKVREKQRQYDALCRKIEQKRAELMDIESLMEKKQELLVALTGLFIQAVDYKEAVEQAVTQVDAPGSGQDAKKCVTRKRKA